MIAVAIAGFPDGVGLADGFSIAAATGRLRAFEFSFDLTNQYTFWSGTIAAFFLFCSYFGTDQSQVQRYLTAKSVDEARHSLLMSGYWKIPLQALVLVLGVLVFVFYVFNPPPMIFSRTATERLSGDARAAYTALRSEHTAAVGRRREAATALARARQAGDASRGSRGPRAGARGERGAGPGAAAGARAGASHRPATPRSTTSTT